MNRFCEDVSMKADAMTTCMATPGLHAWLREADIV